MFLNVQKAKFVERVAAAPEWKLVHRQSDAVVLAMRTVYERAVRAVELATPWDQVGDRLEAARLDVDDLIPWGSVGAVALFDPWTRILGDLFLRMGRISSRRLPVFTKRRTIVAGIFDPVNQRALTWAERNAADLVVVHADVQRLAIRERSHHSDGWACADCGKHPAVDGEFPWSLGGRHFGRRDYPF